MNDTSETWEDYFNDRLICKKESFCIVKPNDCNVTPISCPLCTFLYKTKDDQDSHDKFSCCDKCATTWAYSNREKWDNGWRPDEKTILLNVATRSPMSVNLKIQ